MVMAEKKVNSTVKVKAIYNFNDQESLMLWGIVFTLDDGSYYANLSESNAKALINAGRVVKV